MDSNANDWLRETPTFDMRGFTRLAGASPLDGRHPNLDIG